MLPQEERCTYGTLLELDDGSRYELFDGVLVALASPSTLHQEISGELFAQLHGFLRDKPCRVYAAPVDVRLFEQESDSPDDVDTVVQPDLLVVCDKSKIDDRGIRGAPDLIVEITSPSTRRNDRLIKFGLYRRAGVREYWLVDPETQTVQTHVLDEGQYPVGSVYTAGAQVPVGVLPGCVIDLGPVFPRA